MVVLFETNMLFGQIYNANNFMSFYIYVFSYIIGLWLLLGANAIEILFIWMHFWEDRDFLVDPYY